LTIEALFGEQIGEPVGRLHVKRLETGAFGPVVEVEPPELAVLEVSVDTDVPAAVVFVEVPVEVSDGTATSTVVALPLTVVSIRPAVGLLAVADVVVPGELLAVTSYHVFLATKHEIESEDSKWIRTCMLFILSGPTSRKETYFVSSPTDYQ